MKERIVMLAKVTRPELSPNPTPTRDKKAPVADKARRVFLPRRFGLDSRKLSENRSECERTDLDQEDGWECHDDVHNGDTEGDERSEVGKGFGENVVAIVQYCSRDEVSKIRLQYVHHPFLPALTPKRGSQVFRNR